MVTVETKILLIAAEKNQTVFISTAKRQHDICSDHLIEKKHK